MQIFLNANQPDFCRADSKDRLHGANFAGARLNRAMRCPQIMPTPTVARAEHRSKLFVVASARGSKAKGRHFACGGAIAALPASCPLRAPRR